MSRGSQAVQGLVAATTVTVLDFAGIRTSEALFRRRRYPYDVALLSSSGDVARYGGRLTQTPGGSGRDYGHQCPSLQLAPAE